MTFVALSPSIVPIDGSCLVRLLMNINYASLACWATCHSCAVVVCRIRTTPSLVAVPAISSHIFIPIIQVLLDHAKLEPSLQGVAQDLNVLVAAISKLQKVRVHRGLVAMVRGRDLIQRLEMQSGEEHAMDNGAMLLPLLTGS